MIFVGIGFCQFVSAMCFRTGNRFAVAPKLAGAIAENCQTKIKIL